MKRKRIELPNIIGCRRILSDLRKIEAHCYADARAMKRMAKDADTIEEFEYWKTRARENRDFADKLDAFIDIYKII